MDAQECRLDLRIGNAHGPEGRMAMVTRQAAAGPFLV